MERKKRMLTGLAAAGVLAGALAGGGVALADSGGPAVPVTTVAAAGPAAASTTATAGTAKGGVRFLRRARAARLVLRTCAAYLGLTPAELHAQLKAGKSLASVATARGKSVSGLENAIVARVVKRVGNSRLSAARKAAVIADVKANVGAFVTATHPLGWAARRLGHAAAGSAATPSSSPTASTSAA